MVVPAPLLLNSFSLIFFSRSILPVESIGELHSTGFTTRPKKTLASQRKKAQTSRLRLIVENGHLKESGLQYKIVLDGDGPIPTTGQRIKADYTGMGPPGACGCLVPKTVLVHQKQHFPISPTKKKT